MIENSKPNDLTYTSLPFAENKFKRGIRICSTINKCALLSDCFFGAVKGSIIGVSSGSIFTALTNGLVFKALFIGAIVGTVLGGLVSLIYKIYQTIIIYNNKKDSFYNSKKEGENSTPLPSLISSGVNENKFSNSNSFIINNNNLILYQHPLRLPFFRTP